MDKPVYLSIIVPCYNGEKTIRDTIESILSQKRAEVELVIVNDGSVDGTDGILRQYEQAGAIRYYRTENCGAGHARNYGMAKARGTWIAFLDADDLYIEGCLDKVIPALEKYESQGIEVVYAASMKGDMQMTQSVVRHAEEIAEIKHIPIYEFVSCLYRREFMNRKNIRFFEYKEQDVESAFRFSVFANEPNAVTDNSLCFYYQRINPNSNQHTWKEDVLHRVKSRIYLELLETNPKKSEDSWLLRVVLKEVGFFYRHCLKRGCPDDASMAQVKRTYDRALELGKTIPRTKDTVRFGIAARFYSTLVGWFGKKAQG